MLTAFFFPPWQSAPAWKGGDWARARTDGGRVREVAVPPEPRTHLLVFPFKQERDLFPVVQGPTKTSSAARSFLCQRSMSGTGTAGTFPHAGSIASLGTGPETLFTTTVPVDG